jgi:hypothetical protein
MTKKVLMNYVPALLVAFALIGVSFASASEVTGTLSSKTSTSSVATGDIGGTVSSSSLSTGDIGGTVSSDGSGGGSSSGGTRSNSGSSSGGGSGRSSADSAPDGAVLGATSDNVSAPSFPSTGSIAEEHTPFSFTGSVSMVFTSIMTFIANVL